MFYYQNDSNRLLKEVKNDHRSKFSIFSSWKGEA